MDTIICADAHATRAFAATWGSQCRGGEVLALSGPLGAGKTEFVKGLATGLGICTEVTSPTFNLIHEYQGGRLPLYHFDLYRLEEPREAIRLGLDEYFSGKGVCVLEWPERLPGLLPAHTQFLEIKPFDEHTRHICGQIFSRQK